MNLFIRDRQLTADNAVSLDDEAALPASGTVIVSLKRWTEQRDALATNAALRVGVRLDNTADLATVWPLVADRELIEIDFPAFGDGRAYSQARLLRERYAFRGEIRARGAAVVLDQARELARCGVNAFVLRDDQKVDGFLEQLKKADGTPWYQAPIGTARPGFLRRAG